MKATVLSHRVLENIPSASGIEFLNDQFYIISDNSVWLYILNSDFEIVNLKQIFPEPELKNGVIPKKNKPDFEALTIINTDNGIRLFVLGSGSKSPERDKAFLFNTETLNEDPEELSLTDLYDYLRKLPEVAEGYKLNIEGVAASEDKIFLLQRGNISENNALITYDKLSFLNYLQNKTTLKPNPEIKNFTLPTKKKILSGFSGASYVAEREFILFTATIEDTENEIEDGPTLGNFIGIVDLENPKSAPDCALVMIGEDVFNGKIESITPILIHENYIKAIAVTDNDGEASEILEIELTW